MPQGLQRTRTRLLQAALLIGSTLSALMLAEVSVRLLAPQKLLVPTQDELDGVLTARPGVRGRFMVPGTFDTTISYTAQRFRGPDVYRQTPEDRVLRIAAIGDSLTFGVGANDDETYPVVLQKRLSQELELRTARRRVEVINAGNPGSGTGDQVLLFANWVSRFEPQIVILNMHSNDLDDDAGRMMFAMDQDGDVRPRPRQELAAADSTIRRLRDVLDAFPLYPLLAQHSHAFQLVRDLVSKTVVSRRAEAFQGEGVAAEGDSRRERVAIMVGEIRWLRQKVERSKARLVVTYLPPEWWSPDGRPDLKRDSELIVDALGKLSASDGIPFIDVTPVIRGRAENADKPLYYRDRDWHPKPAAYAIFGEVVADFLLSQGILADGS